MKNLHAFFAVHRRNMLLLRRQRSLLIQAAIVPVAMLILSTMVYGGFGDAYPVGLVNKSSSAQAKSLEHDIRTAHSDITPWFNVVTHDDSEARSLVSWGRLNTVIEIPRDYAHTHDLTVRNYNVNSDAVKNTMGRIQLVINRAEVPGAKLRIESRMAGAHPHDVWRTAYLGGSSVLLALFFGAMLLASNLFMFERENSTRKEILLTPLRPVTAGLANVFSAMVVTILLSLIPLGLSYWIAHFEVGPGKVLLLYLYMLPVMIFCAGVGIFAGHFLKYFRAAQPVIVLGSMVTFFIGGGFTMVSWLQPAARAFDAWWPFSRIFTWMNPFLYGFRGLTAAQLTTLLLAALVGVLLVWAGYRLEGRSKDSRSM
ncbi:ABC transporter permease [Streptomyces purpurogeneiscleroticus]|uniref:ABC transporter permease n=1 Tax=Streptomyces purpurogeneiscleroticus TaxID=68259 RepID=UPI001CC1319C|nr:ABC transporter permease [Streptomyces purpurogeneiscleroticus]MBZ4016043.1 hypothetical protein [Streptomyces purpurogeneiscleroticus]